MTIEGDNSIKKIPFRRFQEFHKRFKGDTYQVCIECGGKCEYNKIGTLLPGEKEFIAKFMRMSVNLFENMYLDRLITPLGDVDVLKMVYGCPFLDDQFRCTIRDVKVVVCEIYPIIFSVNGDSVRFKLDDRCPLSIGEKISRYFLETGVGCLKALEIPLEWFKIVAEYDDYNFDYKQIEKLRKDKQMYETFHLPDIMKFKIQ